MPSKRCTPALSAGRGISVMVDILARSGMYVCVSANHPYSQPEG